LARNWDPFKDLMKLQASINRKLEETFKNYRLPHCHISHGAKMVEVDVKLPGINKKDMEISIKPRMIIIKAESKKSKKTKGFHSEDIISYFRKIALSPGLNVSKAKARFSKGILRIKIPKR